jgi:hypothetical protein
VQFAPERTGRGCRLVISPDGVVPVVIEVRGARVRDGAVRASLVVRRGGAIVETALVTLTSGLARKQFVDTLREKGIEVPEQALVALDEVCHAGARAADELEDHDSATELPLPLGASRPLDELLDAVELLLNRYVIFRGIVQRTAVALWVAHAHALEVADVTPYLHVYSAEKESGKTRLLEVLEWLVPRPWHVIGPSEAVLFRKIDHEMPTLLFDEVDTIFRGPKSRTPEAAGLRQVLNAGYRRSAVVPRCSGKDKIELVDFRVFCAKALTGIGAALPDTVVSRSIPIELARRTKAETVAKFKQRTIAAETSLVRRGLAVWARTAIGLLREVEPMMPDGLGDRAEEVWEPLVAIADLASGEWPARARQAALALNGAHADSESAGVQLLGAIRAVFYPRPPTPDAPAPPQLDKVLTIDLLRVLVDRESDPWPGWWGKDVDQAKGGETPRKPAMELAQHLKPFGIQPKSVRVGGQPGRGYERQDFDDAFSRYLPTKGRYDVTTLGREGVEALRPPAASGEVVTPETLAAQGLSRRNDLDRVESPRRGIGAAMPPLLREPGED